MELVFVSVRKDRTVYSSPLLFNRNAFEMKVWTTQVSWSFPGTQHFYDFDVREMWKRKFPNQIFTTEHKFISARLPLKCSLDPEYRKPMLPPSSGGNEPTPARLSGESHGRAGQTGKTHKVTVKTTGRNLTSQNQVTVEFVYDFYFHRQ